MTAIFCRYFFSVHGVWHGGSGRAIEFDKERGLSPSFGMLSTNAKNPDYSFLPPVTYQKPVDPQEMGADPKVGYRMKLDTKKKQNYPSLTRPPRI